MDDSEFGTEDRRGYWTPHKPLRYPEVFVWPPRLRGILAWLPGYLFPWTALYAALTLVVFFFLTPAAARMQNLSADWVGLIALRNYALLIAVVGAQHYWLYVRKAQGTAFKYNRRWPQPRNKSFTFNTQTRDNLFWSLAFGVPVWTAWECAAWWLYANGYVAQLDPGAAPVWFALLSHPPPQHQPRPVVGAVDASGGACAVFLGVCDLFSAAGPPAAFHEYEPAGRPVSCAGPYRF